jgi:hypothetical protein
MMDKTTILAIVSVIAILAVTIIIVFFITKNEKFVNCTGIGVKTPVDLSSMHKLYNEGKLTEFVEMNKGPGWPQMTWDQFLEHENAKNHTPQ